MSRRLTLLPAYLRAAGFTDIPTYRKIRELAVDGLIPAKQLRAIWYFSELDFPEILAALDLSHTATRFQAA